MLIIGGRLHQYNLLNVMAAQVDGRRDPAHAAAPEGPADAKHDGVGTCKARKDDHDPSKQPGKLPLCQTDVWVTT